MLKKFFDEPVCRPAMVVAVATNKRNPLKWSEGRHGLDLGPRDKPIINLEISD